ncbi:MAG TPA: DUF2269 family protein [Acidimicrobiales bacterium]|jgi:uncharacterized membrane protein|nr:DUF2269 family protein [Acidimicrobiales bacterium]
MGTDSTAYDIVLVLHILAVIFGFGPLVLSGLYDVVSAKRGRRQAAAVGEVQYAVAKTAEKVVYLVFVFGVALVLMSDGAWSMGDLWISLSMLTYVLAIGLSHGMLMPNERRLNAVKAELAALEDANTRATPEQEGRLAALTKRSAAVGTVLDLMLVFIVYLMVFKPGM